MKTNINKIYCYLFKTIFFSFILFLPLIQSCNYFSKKNESITQNPVDTLAVDENLQPLMTIISGDYEHLQPERKIFTYYSPTKNCIADLVNGKSGFCMVTRQFNKEETDFIKQNNLDIKKYDIATDAIAFIVNPDNPVGRVTSDDLKKILSGEYKEWTDLNVKLEGGKDPEEQNNEVKTKMKGSENKIKLFIQRQNSGTYEYLKDSILGDLSYSKSAQICSTNVQILDNIRSNKNAIGISNLSWLSKGNQDSLDASVKPLRISRIYANGRRDEFRQLHQGLVYQKTYPYIRYVHLYCTDLLSRINTAFISFLIKTKGQSLILENGLVPLTQPVRVIQLN
jgi:phosphate transport system substrate-binding protein